MTSHSFECNTNELKTEECNEAICQLIDTSKVIELEHIDAATLPNKPLYRMIKRLFDVISCTIALIILAIPMVVVAILIKLDTPGPVFYLQERLGRNGTPFTIVKFRSMLEDAEEHGARWATEADPRITRVGRVMRKTRFDEIPQFFNVIKGDMSLIGPRPEREIFYEQFEPYIHGFRQRLLVKPGVSGLAQVSGGYKLKPAEKILYDLEYIKTRSIALDIKIVFKTLKVLFLREGAY